jgi:hypothetical protein
MSFLQGLVDFGKTAISFLSGNSMASTIVKTIGIGLVLNQVSKSINKDNQKGKDANIDAGVRLQVAPAADNRVPVLYGQGYFGGIITDAVMTNTNKTMFYCLTLCEKTGNKLSDGQPSELLFKDIYWNDQRIVFNSDGITANYTVDRSGVIDTSISNNVKVWCYKNGSSTPATLENYTTLNTVNAYDIMPNWTSSTHQMSSLAFAIVQVNYNRDKNITGIGNMLFQVENNMKLPGDCLYDYMTNTRYGAGIDASEIYSS